MKPPPHTAADLFDRLSGLRRYSDRKRGYRPHKPLLILVAIGRFQQGDRWVTFGSIEQQMCDLLRAFAPATAGSLSPEDPFWHLRTDGLWDIVDRVDMQGNGKNPSKPSLRLARGGFPQQVVNIFLRDPYLPYIVVERILHDYFPGDKKDKAPSRCQRGDPRVRVACQPGGLDVKDRVEEREDTPWDGL